jgi:hypothetical protein
VHQPHVLPPAVARGRRPLDEPDAFQRVEMVCEQIRSDAVALGQLTWGPVADDEVVDDRESRRVAECGMPCGPGEDVVVDRPSEPRPALSLNEN